LQNATNQTGQARSRVKWPVLYLSVENYSREFDAKLLVGCALAERGVLVVIGQQWLLNANLGRMPMGMVFFKGLNRVQVGNMERAKRIGHVAVANDEEAVGVADEKFMLHDIDEGLPPHCDLLLCQGERQRQSVKNHFPEMGDRLVVVGNPRIDLVRPEFRVLYEEEAARIREEQGRFVLINTNLGGVNSGWGDINRYRQVLINIGWFDPTKPEDRALFREHIVQDKLNQREVYRLIDILRASLPDRCIIVRPHPSEKIDTWQKKYSDTPRVKVIHQGSHLPWILASDILIHTGCTTGFEAQVADHPTISIRPGDLPFRFFHTSNVTNMVAERAEQAAEMVQTFLYEDPEMFARAKPELTSRIAEHFAYVTGEFAFRRTADVLFELFKRDVRSIGRFRWQVAPGFVKEIPREDYIKRKMSMTHAEFDAHLAKLQRVLGTFGNLASEEIGDSLFLLRRRDA